MKAKDDQQTLAPKLGMSEKAMAAALAEWTRARKKRQEKSRKAVEAFRRKLKKIDDLIQDLNKASQEASDGLDELEGKVDDDEPKADIGRP